MKKNLLYIIALLPLLQGCCGRRNKSTSKTSGNVAIELEKNKGKNGAKKNIFIDDAVGQFEFEEEEGAFSANAMKDSATLNLVESAQAREWEERRAAQAKHGFKVIYFDFGQYEIRADQAAALKHDVAAVKKLISQGYDIVVEGHACNSAGSEAYNLQLSADRAKSVKKHLVGQGIPAERIKTVGRGFEMCVVPAGNREQQSSNRRVEFYVEVPRAA